MNLDHFFLMSAFAYLRADKNEQPKIKKHLNSLGYDLNTPRAPKVYSLAGVNSLHKECGFFEWADEIVAERVLELSIDNLNRVDVPDHIANSFLGGIVDFLFVKTAKRHRVFSLAPIYSPRFEAEPKHLLELINAQSDAVHYKQVLKKQLSNHLNLNHIEFNDQADFDELLLNLDPQTWDFQLDNLLRELQVEMLACQKRMIMPETLHAYFEWFESDFPHGESDYAYFYSLQPISGQQLVNTLKAQPHCDLIRKKIKTWLQSIGDSAEFDIEGPDWELQITRLDEVGLESWRHSIGRGIADHCTEAKIKPVIPEELREFWGPDEEELKRIKARGVISNEEYVAKPNSNSWQLYRFTEIDLGGATLNISIKNNLEKVLRDFTKALDAACRFALEVDSPFAEAFKLSLFVLNTETTPDDFVLKLTAAGFSPHAVTIAQEKYFMVDRLGEMKFTPQEVKILLAYECSAVFGGMGSWNDIGFTSQEEQRRYDEVTTSLYATHSEIFKSLLEYKAQPIS